jgi:hypothetical protein
MRTGIILSVTHADLDSASRALVKDRNEPQKRVWRAQIVLLSADDAGTNAIMRETGKSKTCIWRLARSRHSAPSYSAIQAVQGLITIRHGREQADLPLKSASPCPSRKVGHARAIAPEGAISSASSP